jgi:hypothetical protein
MLVSIDSTDTTSWHTNKKAAETMIKLVRYYIRYAATVLSTVGFGIRLN